MGAGKTKIGRSLASHLSLPFIDTDYVIETEAGRSITDIFKHDGEDEFRRLERQLLAHLITQSPRVIATGGGMFIDPQNRELISGNAISVWIRAELSSLLRRTSRSNKRPLLATGEDPRLILADLMRQRDPIYAQADITVNHNHETGTQVVEQLLECLADFRSSSCNVSGSIRESRNNVKKE